MDIHTSERHLCVGGGGGGRKGVCVYVFVRGWVEGCVCVCVCVCVCPRAPVHVCSITAFAGGGGGGGWRQKVRANYLFRKRTQFCILLACQTPSNNIHGQHSTFWSKVLIFAPKRQIAINMGNYFTSVRLDQNTPWFYLVKSLYEAVYNFLFPAAFAFKMRSTISKSLITSNSKI